MPFEIQLFLRSDACCDVCSSKVHVFVQEMASGNEGNDRPMVKSKAGFGGGRGAGGRQVVMVMM